MCITENNRKAGPASNNAGRGWANTMLHRRNALSRCTILDVNTFKRGVKYQLRHSMGARGARILWPGLSTQGAYRLEIMGALLMAADVDLGLSVRSYRDVVRDDAEIY